MNTLAQVPMKLFPFNETAARGNYNKIERLHKHEFN